MSGPPCHRGGLALRVGQPESESTVARWHRDCRPPGRLGLGGGPGRATVTASGTHAIGPGAIRSAPRTPGQLEIEAVGPLLTEPEISKF